MSWVGGDTMKTLQIMRTDRSFPEILSSFSLAPAAARGKGLATIPSLAGRALPKPISEFNAGLGTRGDNPRLPLQLLIQHPPSVRSIRYRYALIPRTHTRR
jgi:hypothetical protein